MIEDEVFGSFWMQTWFDKKTAKLWERKKDEKSCIFPPKNQSILTPSGKKYPEEITTIRDAKTDLPTVPSHYTSNKK